MNRKQGLHLPLDVASLSSVLFLCFIISLRSHDVLGSGPWIILTSSDSEFVTGCMLMESLAQYYFACSSQFQISPVLALAITALPQPANTCSLDLSTPTRGQWLHWAATTCALIDPSGCPLPPVSLILQPCPLPSTSLTHSILGVPEAGFRSWC